MGCYEGVKQPDRVTSTDKTPSQRIGLHDSSVAFWRWQAVACILKAARFCDACGGTMTDVLDLEVSDPIVLAELVMTADLMIAANTTERHLSQHTIDVALGLAPGLRVIST